MARVAEEVLEDVTALVRDLVDAGRGAVVGVYVHGSAALGDFLPGRSDLDLLVVIDDRTDDEIVDELTATLAAIPVSAAIGVEASIVERTDAAAARPPWRFRSHVTTAPSDPKVVDGRGHPGDPDLALHYLVARRAGWTASGREPNEVFGELDRALIIEHLAAELRWGAREAPTTYAVLNACRALRFAAEDAVCSKTDGGRWALERGIEPELVAASLADRTGVGPPPPDRARAWVLAVADELAES